MEAHKRVSQSYRYIVVVSFDTNNFAGTRFRPLSLDLPKPLFPIAGRSIIQHHIEACVQLKELKEILVIGYYPASQIEKFVSEMQNLYDVSIR